MKTLALTLLIIVSLYLNNNAQSISLLDSIHGFKEFKLNDPLNKYQDINGIAEIRMIDEDLFYDYQGNCCNTILDEKIRNIGLIFNKEQKLKGIGLILENYYSISEMKSLIEKFSFTFGKAYTGHDENMENIEATWSGDSTLLGLHFKYDEKYKKDFRFSAKVIITKYSPQYEIDF